MCVSVFQGFFFANHKLFMIMNLLFKLRKFVLFCFFFFLIARNCHTTPHHKTNTYPMIEFTWFTGARQKKKHWKNNITEWSDDDDDGDFDLFEIAIKLSSSMLTIFCYYYCHFVIYFFSHLWLLPNDENWYIIDEQNPNDVDVDVSYIVK